jgi:hypothetical protein
MGVRIVLRLIVVPDEDPIQVINDAPGLR